MKQWHVSRHREDQEEQWNESGIRVVMTVATEGREAWREDCSYRLVVVTALLRWCLRSKNGNCRCGSLQCEAVVWECGVECSGPRRNAVAVLDMYYASTTRFKDRCRGWSSVVSEVEWWSSRLLCYIHFDIDAAALEPRAARRSRLVVKIETRPVLECTKVKLRLLERRQTSRPKVTTANSLSRSEVTLGSRLAFSRESNGQRLRLKIFSLSYGPNFEPHSSRIEIIPNKHQAWHGSRGSSDIA